ncbi:MAG: DUF1616 domain-containing protein [bacterium]
MLGLGIALVLPGFLILRALFPGSSELSTPEWLVLSLALSVATVPLFLYPLHYTPGGIGLREIGALWRLTQQAGSGDFTEFYVLNSAGRAEEYPTAVRSGEGVVLTLGVGHQEKEAARYYLVAECCGRHRLRVAEVPVSTIYNSKTKRSLVWQGIGVLTGVIQLIISDLFLPHKEL